MDEAAPPLETFLGDLPELLGNYRFEDMVVVKDLTAEWPTNWKIALDAFLEGYHAHARHPELLRLVDDYHYQFDMFDGGHSRMIIPMGRKSPRISDRASLTPELRVALADAGLDPADFEGRQEEVRQAILEAKRQWAAGFGLDYSRFTDSQVSDDWNYSIFPNITLNVHPEGVLVMRFRPHPTDPERCFYDTWVLATPVEDRNYKLPFYMGVAPDADLSGNGERPQRVKIQHGEAGLGFVLDQDGEFLPLVQKGIRSAGFRGVRLSRQEVRLLHYYTEYNGYLGDVA
jgi:phenylpropionate dioxygenase-like ring-hydroxylating dioxygenase large terminal subunit